MKAKHIFGTLCLLLVIALFSLNTAKNHPAYATSQSTLSLSGSNYLQVSNSPWLNPAMGITVEAWVKLPAEPSDYMTIIGKNWYTNYWLGINPDRYPRFYAAGIGTLQDASVQVPIGEWTHIAGTYDGVTTKIYVNGIMRGSLPTSNYLVANTDPMQIGADLGIYRFTGAIADVRLWSVARTQTQIRQDMVHLPGTSQPDLLAAWALEGSGADLFGRVNMTGVNSPAWTGGAAPPFLYNSILIPRLAAAPSSISDCSSSSYTGALRVPIWYGDAHSAPNPVWVYIGATATDVYVCFDQVELTAEFTGLYLDADNSGDAYAQASDIRLMAYKNSTYYAKVGDGAGGFDTEIYPVPTWSGQYYLYELYATVGYRVPRAWLTAVDGRFRMMFGYHWVGGTPGNDFDWPVNGVWNSPTSWPIFTINDSSIPPADSQNPTIVANHSPSPVVLAGQTVTIRADATDDVDIAQLDILVNGSVQRSCTFTGSSDTSASCTYSFSPLVGQNTYYAHVIDQRGRSGYSPLNSFFAQIDGHAPTVSLSHTPRKPVAHQSVNITAIASDASGITDLRILFDFYPFSHTCPVSGNTTETCSFSLSPGNRRIVHYWAWAEDNEHQEVETGRVPVLLGNYPTTGDPDSDYDGIIDSLENLLGTDATNPDTDRDALMDGWEVLGVEFWDGSFINLPAMGANPLRKSIFVQYDYERGAHVGPNAWPYAINLFRSHNIDLFVTEVERPRTGLTSTLTAETAAATLDGSGHYYFDPKKSLTHHYVFSRHYMGRSSAWHFVTININTGGDCPMSSTDPQNDPNCRPHAYGQHVDRDYNGAIYVIIHELGHSLGLGHGGRTGGNTQVRVGDTIHYYGSGGDWRHTNWKPNYLSIMNYRYNIGPVICMDSQQRFVGAFDFDHDLLPDISEEKIDESDQDFHEALSNVSCPAGSQAIMTYSCKMNGDSNLRQMRATDGNQVSFIWHDGTWYWSSSGVSSLVTGGVDWDCDNTLEIGGVNTNVNGDSGENGFGDGSNTDYLDSQDEWPGLPYQAGHGCSIVTENPPQIPTAYKQLISASDCSTNPPGLLIATEASQPAPHAPDPASNDGVLMPPLPNLEICNGLDDDNDQQVDEGCPDGDYDGIVDALDNCPGTWNYDQADLDANHLGDTCQNPQISDLSISSDGVARTLQWNVSSLELLGYNVYRQCLGENSLRLLQAYPGDFPTTTEAGYKDDLLPTCSYCVSAVNLVGQDTGTMCSYQYGIFLPSITK